MAAPVESPQLKSGLTTAVNSPLHSTIELQKTKMVDSTAPDTSSQKSTTHPDSTATLHDNTLSSPPVLLVPPAVRLTFAQNAIRGDAFIPSWAERKGEWTEPEIGKGEIPYAGKGTEAEPYVVDWLPNEPRNPYNWTNAYKWLFTGFCAIATLCIAFASSCYSGAAGAMVETFDVSEEIVILGISLYVIGFGAGPLVWSPASEIYGRRLPFLVSYFPFAFFNMGGAFAKNIETVIITRFFTGFFGSSMLTNAGGCIADTWSAKERGLAMSFYSLAPFLGPVIGPIVGGFVAAGDVDGGWRFVFWVMFMFGIACFVGGFFLLPECYPPVLLRRKAADLQKATEVDGKPTVYYIGKFDLTKRTNAEILKINFTRPFQLLFKETIVLVLAVYCAIIYGILYLFFTAYPIVFQSAEPRGYGFGSGIGSLPFVGIGIGLSLGTAMTPINNRIYLRHMKASPTGIAPPEARLPLAILGGILLPVGIFFFAWTGGPTRAPWIAPTIAGAFFGLGMMLVFTAIMSYLVDCYLLNAASALAANAVMRSILGAVFPLFSTYMYDNLGDAWASSVLGFLALACAPAPFLFYKYGPTIRKKSKYAPNLTPAQLAAIFGGGAPVKKDGEALEKTQSHAVGLPAPAGPIAEDREGSMYSALEPEYSPEAGMHSHGDAPQEMVSEKPQVIKGENLV